jgi:flagellum-specific peptidoglycan hydrolase FlgJ
LIRNNPRYENALDAGANVASFASALQQGGYATDPHYASKIVAVVSEMRDLVHNAVRTNSFKVADARPIPSGGGA